MRVVFTGGGTGGHIFPIIALTREISRVFSKYSSFSGKEKKLRLFYVGPKDELSLSLLSQEEIKVKTVSAGKIRRYFGVKAFLANFIDIFRTIIGTCQAFSYLFWLGPDLIFSKGGYGSLPVVLAGKLLRIPIFLHESDSVVGLTNRILGGFSLEIFISFPYTNSLEPSKIILAGNPIRKEILEGSAERAKKLFNLTSKKPVILIMGGSQGAQRINNVILTVLPQMLENFEVIHQTGPKNFKQVKAEAGVVITEGLKNYYHPYPFLKEKELKHAYKVSDLIVARAGSGTIFEIAALAKPSILIPLPEAAQQHQIKNAYIYANNKASIVIEETNLTPHFFLETLKNLLSNPKQLATMKKQAKEFSKPKAAEIITNYIIEYLTQR